MRPKLSVDSGQLSVALIAGVEMPPGLVNLTTNN